MNQKVDENFTMTHSCLAGGFRIHEPGLKPQGTEKADTDGMFVVLVNIAGRARDVADGLADVNVIDDEAFRIDDEMVSEVRLGTTKRRMGVVLVDEDKVDFTHNC